MRVCKLSQGISTTRSFLKDGETETEDGEAYYVDLQGKSFKRPQGTRLILIAMVYA